MANDRTVFLDTVHHRSPERVLYHFSCTPDLKRRLQEHIGSEDIVGHYGLSHSWRVAPRRPTGSSPPDFSRYWAGEDLPEGTEINDIGVAVVPSGFYHFTGTISPLRNAGSLDEIEAFPIEDVSTWDVSHYEEQIAQAHREGRLAATWAGHMYETAWQIRGYEQFLMDLIDRPAWAESILDRLFENNRFRAVAAAKAGVEAIYCGDDVANQKSMMFSPEIWRTFMLSRWRNVWDAARQINPDIVIHYHSDGNIIDIVPDLVEAGLTVLNPVQPECLDARAIHRRFGDRLSFDGCIGTQSTMPFGSPQDVRARVRECIEQFDHDGGLILAPTHTLEPEVPIENIEAFVDACRELGRRG
jgi:uroporphyrinogen decarboxylase